MAINLSCKIDRSWVGTMSHCFRSQSSTRRMYVCLLPSHRGVIGVPQKKAANVDSSNSRLGRKWAEWIDKELLRELE